MFYEGLLLLRTPEIPINKIFVVGYSDNFVANNIEAIETNVNLLCKEYIKLTIEFLNPEKSVSDNDLRTILAQQYKVESNRINTLIKKSRENKSFNFWEILRNNNIKFHKKDSEIFNAFVVLAFSTDEYQIYRFGIHSLEDAKDFSRLIFNEFDCIVRSESFGFQGFSGWIQETEITTTSSPNVGIPLNDQDKKKLSKINEKIAEIVDTIQKMDREEGISWLSKIIGNNMVENLNIDNPNPSALKIDNDYKLRLTDLSNAEIKIDPLSKSLYFMYLIHSEGIATRYYELYENQMLEIYKTLSNRADVDKLRESVRRLIEPCSDLMPQKISRIRRKFLEFFPRTVVDEFYIPRYTNENENWIRRIFLSKDKIEITKELDSICKMKIKIPKPPKRKRNNDEIIIAKSDSNDKFSEVHFDDEGKRGIEIHILE